MSELLVSVAITGSLIAIGTPTYLNQTKAGCQRQTEAAVSQILTQAQAYNDEFGERPKGWSNLDKVATIMTSNGPAQSDSFDEISLAGCNYRVSGNTNDMRLDILAKPKQVHKGGTPLPYSDQAIETTTTTDGYNVIGCINYATGASDIRRGNGSDAAKLEILKCS
jgi:type II secretory pathway pseudopilin PulG